MHNFKATCQKIFLQKRQGATEYFSKKQDACGLAHLVILFQFLNEISNNEANRGYSHLDCSELSSD